MRNFILLLFLPLCLARCAETDQIPDACSNIEGTWSCENKDVFGRPTTYVYAFGSGLLSVMKYDGGTLIAEYRYAYACNVDTLDLLNLATHGKQTAKVQLLDENTLLLDLTNWPTITLNRIL